MTKYWLINFYPTAIFKVLSQLEVDTETPKNNRIFKHF